MSNSQNAGQIREKNSDRMARCESFYKAECNRLQISESKNVVPRRKSFQYPRQSADRIFLPKREARNTNDLESWGSCSSLKDRSDVVFECGEEKILKDNKTSRQIKKDADVQISIKLAAANELQKDHSKMLSVLKSRKSVIETVQLKLEHEGYDGLLMWLITSKEDTLTVDVLPQLCKGLQKRRDDGTRISPMLALMLIPSILSLLGSRYEDYMSKALDYIEAFLCEIPPPRCQLYDSCMQELHELLVFLNTDSHKLLQCRHETCFKIQVLEDLFGDLLN